MINIEDKEKLAKGFLNIVLLGRYQKLSNNPEVIIDVAHNADSAKKLKLNLLKFPKKRTIAVLGVLIDKDVYSLIKPMAGIIDKWFCGTIDSERGMNSEEIKTRMSTVVNKKYVSTYPNMNSAFYEAIKTLKKDDRLIIYGSFYTVSEFLLYFKYNKRKLVNY
ncbi:MAG: glutamate ligase domain-containing protein [Gammaproteobacteria bacterium]